jgi:hypothetical protein
MTRGPFPDTIDEISVDRFDPNDVADAVLRSHNDDVMAAIENAVMHTLIDGAAFETFVDDAEPSDFRDAVGLLQDAGYGYGDDVAWYAGEIAVDEMRDAYSSPYNYPEDFEDGFSIDGFDVKQTVGPKCIATLVDPKALSRIPSGVVQRRAGGRDANTVSSPIVVTDPNGVVVVNIAEDTGDE